MVRGKDQRHVRVSAETCGTRSRRNGERGGGCGGAQAVVQKAPTSVEGGGEEEDACVRDRENGNGGGARVEDWIVGCTSQATKGGESCSSRLDRKSEDKTACVCVMWTRRWRHGNDEVQKLDRARGHVEAQGASTSLNKTLALPLRRRSTSHEEQLDALRGFVSPQHHGGGRRAKLL